MKKFILTIPALLSLVLTILLFKGYGQKSIDLSYYLKNKAISQPAKDFYYHKFPASDDEKTFSIIDSLTTDNNSTRPFYLYLVSNMLKKSDGALAESLGNSCNTFLQSHPNQILEFLYTNRISSPEFIDLWAYAIAGEFMITCEGKENQCVTASFNKLLLKCKTDNKSLLRVFFKKIISKIH